MSREENAVLCAQSASATASDARVAAAEAGHSAAQKQALEASEEAARLRSEVASLSQQLAASKTSKSDTAEALVCPITLHMKHFVFWLYFVGFGSSKGVSLMVVYTK